MHVIRVCYVGTADGYIVQGLFINADYHNNNINNSLVKLFSFGYDLQINQH